MWYSRKQLCDTLGRSGAWFSKIQDKHKSRFDDLYKQGHRKEGNGNQYLYDDVVLAELKLFRVDSAAEQAENAPEAPETPVQPFLDDTLVNDLQDDVKALQAKLEALQALYDKQIEITDILKEQVENKQTEITQLHQLLAREQTLKLNPPKAEPEPDHKHGILYRWFHRAK